MDIVGMGLVTQQELEKIMTPSINKTLKRNLGRKKIVHEPTNVLNITQNNLNFDNSLKLAPIKIK